MLVDIVVKPHQPIVQWQKRHHGVVSKTLNNGSKNGQCIYGWEEARAEMLKYVNEDTVIVGHLVWKSLKILRVTHTRIVDSAILTTDLVYRLGRLRYHRPLTELCQSLVGMNRNGGPNGKDDLEKVLMKREVVLFCLQNPKKLDYWVSKKIIRINQNLPSYRRQARRQAKGIH